MKRAAVLMLLALAGCDPPCPSTEAAHKAAQAFEQCLLMEQHGDGGLACGRAAYNTFCRK